MIDGLHVLPAFAFPDLKKDNVIAKDPVQRPVEHLNDVRLCRATGQALDNRVPLCR